MLLGAAIEAIRFTLPPCSKRRWWKNAPIGGILLKKRCGAPRFVRATEGAGAAETAWTADQRSISLGRELYPVEEKEHAEMDRAAKDRELAAWSKLDVFARAKKGAPSKAVAKARWAIPRGMVNG